MESLPTLYEAAQVYAFFSLVTSITVGVVNGQLLLLLRPFGVAGSISYMMTTIITAFLFAPMFFIILLAFGETYRAAIFSSLLKNVDDDE